MDEKGVEIEGECSGYLCVKHSWPSAFRTLFGDHERYETTYFKPFLGYYFTGDGCSRDEDGYHRLTGRVDDVINVSGHRIGTTEVESALVSHPQCAEAVVVGVEHEQGIYAFVTLVEGVPYSEELQKSLVLAVRQQIGAFAAPERIHWAPGLPKTRSGKEMRRILRKITSRNLDELGDTSTLADPGVVEHLIELAVSCLCSQVSSPIGSIFLQPYQRDYTKEQLRKMNGWNLRVLSQMHLSFELFNFVSGRDGSLKQAMDYPRV